MSASAGPDIITDGLVFCLDAGNRKSYSGSGTVWRDLAGRGLNGTLTNGPTFNSVNGGSIVFDGSNDIVFCPATNSIIGNSQSSITNIIYFKTTNTISRMYASSLKRNTGASTLLSIDINSNDSGGLSSGRAGFLTSNGAGHSWITYNGNVNDGKWHFLGCAVDANGRKLYLDGVLVASDAITLTTASGNTGTYTLGGFDTNNTLFNGSIALSLIYTKALTPQEVLQNYNATKGRFGLA
jgi:hypothetical protein